MEDQTPVQNAPQTSGNATASIKRISKRDLTIAYQIDGKSSYDLADQYQVTHDEMKATIRTAGLVVRKGEIKAQPKASEYSVVLVDGAQETPVVCKA